ncbi:hypothetical protein Lfu02_01480 [Longispora fulva]|uniref:Uncharacterized protein n=1 Tax=Longispora fulva TaxID=619741 RepID=A0A8J7GG30_9ACTN|nr:hypothetical protein [Longispora fulva]MBG6135982.1 hypothetical protein [Longispora fulva]GIG55776.1 hypothetical protein Lfu02_01480 [Longispora fulva]
MHHTLERLNTPDRKGTAAAGRRRAEVSRTQRWRHPRRDRRARTCCWYHGGDWRTASALAIAAVIDAAATGVAFGGVAEHALVRAAAAEEWTGGGPCTVSTSSSRPPPTRPTPPAAAHYPGHTTTVTWVGFDALAGLDLRPPSLADLLPRIAAGQPVPGM